jgi:putative NADH-flavin reductase
VKLALLGATGGVGREVLNQAVAAGHLVTAVVRNPAKLPAHVGVVRQDLANPNTEVLADALRDAEAVISAVGPSRTAQAGIVAPATAAIAHAMDCARVRRLVVISAWRTCCATAAWTGLRSGHRARQTDRSLGRTGRR